MFSIGDVVKVRKRLFQHPNISQTSSKLDGYYHGVIRGVGKSTYDVFFFYDKELVTIHKTNLTLSSEDDYLNTLETKNYIEYKKETSESQIETPVAPIKIGLERVERLLLRAKENSRKYGLKLDPVDIALQKKIALERGERRNRPTAPVKKRKKKSITWQSPVFRKLEPEFNKCI